ncbi:helix-turn-helix transcriptional regulator [Acaryochloris sp. IP29b_bin.148]|uniref:helix-turn-helix domain-containing protein n=1 Tax=Acaryochloris sp. IP29b_bin.148 TaxID=2969218 RepID=UPI0026280A27|nr:helix-turn-helix transcriptional regulator [Acaryochloris sp. IP29b_bin.148]
MSGKSSFTPDYTPQLKQLMQQVGIPSFASLSRATHLSRTQINGVRQGRIQNLRVGQVLQLSQTLQVPNDVLIETFSPSTEIPALEEQSCSTPSFSVNLRKKSEPSSAAPHLFQLQQELETLKNEYRRLQTQLQNQKAQLRQEAQQSTLQMLEPLLLQWPTAAYVARKKPDAPAVKLLPLLRPLEQLLTAWGIVPIGEVGIETTYDPQWHQLMPDGKQPQLGEQVRVRYVGYRQGEQLLYRAKVSPL